MAVPPKYIAADDDDDSTLSFTQPSLAPPSGDYSQAGPSASPVRHASPNPLEGRIGSTPGGGTRSNIGGVRVETRYTGQNTLDEPVSDTILRDLKSIYAKLLQVLYPPRSSTTSLGSAATSREDLLREWDLWGPLVICLGLAIMLSIDAPASQSIEAFSMVISLVTVGSTIVTINAKLLGGKVSFFQSLCVLGYCLAPLLLASILSFFFHAIYIRAPVSFLAVGWAVWASVNFLKGAKLPQSRQILAVYPLCLFYFVLAWMILIQ